MKAVSLFSGCGGTDLGLMRAGIDVVFANDINKWACETYEKNLGLNIVHSDVRKIKYFPKADLLVGCFPCQGFSWARRKKGPDPRNLLYLEFVRALSQVNPDFFVTENVKGLISQNGVEIFQDMMLKFGKKYNVTWKLINAKEYGVPQDRERVFIVGVKKSLKKKFEFPEPTHGLGKRKYVTLRKSIGGMPRPKEGEIYSKGFSWHYLSRNRKRKWGDVSFTIQASGRHAPLHPKGLQPVHVGKDKYMLPPPIERHRRLSYKECAVIQSFPKRFKFYGHLDAKYMQIGNAVPPKISEMIGTAIKGLKK